MRVTMISGRNAAQMIHQLGKEEAASKLPLEVLVHPWTDRHIADGAKAFMRVLRNHAKSDTHLIVVTFQDWMFNLLGEVIATKPELEITENSVEVVLCDADGVRRFLYDNRGFLGHKDSSWPIGYFTYDPL